MIKETKHERFKRLASSRTNNVIRSIRILANCSNKSSYTYKSEDVVKIFNAISNELRIARSKFKVKNNKKEKIFKL